MPQNAEEVVAHRRAIVADLYCKGFTQVKIAYEVGVSQGQISQDLEAIRESWQNSTVFNFNEAKMRELAKLDLLETTMWEAWEASKQPLKKKSSKMRGEVNQADEKDKDAKKKQKVKNLETVESTEERLGDPRYMDAILRCIEKRSRLLGLDAPFKIAATDTEGKNVDAARTWNLLDHTGGHRVPAPDEMYTPIKS